MVALQAPIPEAPVAEEVLVRLEAMEEVDMTAAMAALVLHLLSLAHL
jgi:hypothetical protein